MGSPTTTIKKKRRRKEKTKLLQVQADQQRPKPFHMPFNMLSKSERSSRLSAKPRMKVYLLVAVSLAVLVLSCCLAPVHAASFSSASSSSSGSGGSWTTTNCVNRAMHQVD